MAFPFLDPRHPCLDPRQSIPETPSPQAANILLSNQGMINGREVFAWGRNEDGQLGDDERPEARTRPFTALTI